MKLIFITLLIFFTSLQYSCSEEQNTFYTPQKTSEKKKKTGWVNSFYPNDTLRSKIYYNKGIRQKKSYSYFKNGNPRFEISYLNDKKHGLTKSYYQKGNLYQTIEYLNGERNGATKTYHPNGLLISEVMYFNNELCTGSKEYSKEGQLINNKYRIVFKTIDHTALDGSFELIASVKNMKKVNFYINPKTENGCLAQPLYPINTKTGSYSIKRIIPRGSSLLEEINLYASFKTWKRTPILIKATYRIAIDNY